MMATTALTRITTGTREGFDKRSWLEEAGRHIRSAKLLRAIRRRRRTLFGKAPEQRRLDHVLAMDAAAHSSTLLIAYAVELLLKAGLTAVYIGSSKTLFSHEVRTRFGHKLVAIAKEIEYPLSSADTKLMKELQAVILSQGRYPFLSEHPQQDRERRNKRAAAFWDDRRFRRMEVLLSTLRAHVASLDGDSDNPATFLGFQIDDDGYVAFRCGGNLSPRMIVRYSTKQRRLRVNNRRALKRLLRSLGSARIVTHYWNTARYRCVKH